MKKFFFSAVVIYLLSSCIEKKHLTNDVDEDIKHKLEYEYVFIEATKQKLLGNFNTALALYNSCIKSYKNSGTPYYEISTIYSMIGKKLLAIEYAEQAVKLDQKNIWYCQYLARMYYANKEIDKTIEVYENILKKDNSTEYKYNIAGLYIEKEDYKNALKYLDEVEKEIGVSEEVSLTKENIFLRQNKKELAYAELEKLINYFPSNPRYYGILAELYANNNYIERAKSVYKKIFELDSSNSIAQISYSEFLRKNNEYDLSFSMLENAIRNPETKLETKVYTLRSYLMNDNELKKYNNEIGKLIGSLRSEYIDTINVEALYAEFLIRSEKYDSARIQLKDLINKGNNIDYFWEKLIYIGSFTENFKAMFSDSKKAMELFPEKSGFYLLNAIASIQLKNYDTAIKVLKDGITLIVDNDELTVQYYMYFAEAYNGIKDYENSDKYYEKVLKLEPDNILVLNNYSYYLSLREEKLDKAEKMIIKCIETEPKNSTYLDTYAWVLFKHGRYEEAKRIIEEALEFGGEESEEIIEHYGDILFVTGSKDKALEYWLKAQEMGRDTNELIEKIKNKKL